jgi:hypothetical protein
VKEAYKVLWHLDYEEEGEDLPWDEIEAHSEYGAAEEFVRRHIEKHGQRLEALQHGQEFCTMVRGSEGDRGLVVRVLHSVRLDITDI